MYASFPLFHLVRRRLHGAAHSQHLFAVASGETVSLELAGKVGVGPSLSSVIVMSGGVQGEVGVGEVGAGEGDKVGSSLQEDGVDLVCSGDVADGHGGDTDFVAHLIGKWGLVHASIDRFLIHNSLPSGHINQISPCVFEHVS